MGLTSSGGISRYAPHMQSRYISAFPSSPVETVISDRHHQYPTIRQVKFAMELYKARTSDVIHTYTSIQCVTASTPRLLEGLKHWRTLYPPLAEQYDQGKIDCPMFLFDTKLSLMEDLPGCNAQLSIQNFLDVTQGIHYTNWQSHTSFYEEEGCPVDLAKFYKGSKLGNSLVHLTVHPSTRATDSKLEGLPLKTQWWSAVFSKMIMQHLKARASTDADAVKFEDENIERYIRGISVMQEIYASSRAPDSERMRVAILVWKFSRSRKGEVATTSWHPLLHSVSPGLVETPIPPQLQQDSGLDSTIQDALETQPAAPFGDFYNPQPSMFADNAEELIDATLSEDSSPNSTSPLDYVSFPSSTSTSFPFNISNSCYPPDTGQASSFQSEDSAYSSLTSFASRDSQYHSQELIMETHDVYNSQEGVYHSQDALYHHTTDQIYDWSAAHTLLPNGNACHDFTGGKIQLSYSQEDEAQHFPHYEPTQLYAPRANVQPQYQLIQHPEQFDHHDYLEPDLASASQETDQDQCIDWQLIASQSVQVGDMRFQETEINGDVVRQWEECQEQLTVGDGVDGRGQGHGQVLGEVNETG